MGASGPMRWLASAHGRTSATPSCRPTSPAPAAHLPGGAGLPVPGHPRRTAADHATAPRPERGPLSSALRAGGTRAGHRRRPGAGRPSASTGPESTICECKPPADQPSAAGLLATATLERLPVIRYEYAVLGGLIHLDTKKLGRIVDGPGHRATGDRRDRRRGVAGRCCTWPSTMPPAWCMPSCCPTSGVTPPPASWSAPCAGSPSRASPSSAC